MAGIDAGAVVTVLIQNGPQIIAIGQAIAKDIPAIAGLFHKTTDAAGTPLTPEQVAALVADTEAIDDGVQKTADQEIAAAETQLAEGEGK
jgi:hypothetical protein